MALVRRSAHEAFASTYCESCGNVEVSRKGEVCSMCRELHGNGILNNEQTARIRSMLGIDLKAGAKMERTFTCKTEGCARFVNSNKGAAAYCPGDHRRAYLDERAEIRAGKKPDEKPKTDATGFVSDSPVLSGTDNPLHDDSPSLVTEAPEVEEYEEVVHPSHYGGDSPQEAIKVIEFHELGFHEGSALKYLTRAGKKPGVSALVDLKKARFYIDRKISLLEEQENG